MYSPPLDRNPVGDPDELVKKFGAGVFVAKFMTCGD